MVLILLDLVFSGFLANVIFQRVAVEPESVVPYSGALAATPFSHLPPLRSALFDTLIDAGGS